MRDRLASLLTGRAAICIALAALVFFSRAWLVRAWGSPLPFWDQWDAEAIGLYFPWANGTLHWSDLFRAHNEHHILLTRLADLALFVAYDGWNPWAQMLLNAALHAITAAALATIFWPALPRRERVTFLCGLAVLFTATCGWQNALYGFQSQVYFANVFAVGAIIGLCAGTPLSPRWWLGLLSAVLAFFSNGGGLLAAAAALVVGFISSQEYPRSVKKWTALTLIASGLVLAVLLRPETSQHAAFAARTTGEFCKVLTHCLAWPWINQPLLCVVMQLPLAGLVILRRRQRQPLDAAERCALALGVFAMLQAAAIAYSRGAVLPEARPLSRYQDPLLLGVPGQLFALLKLWSGAGRIERWTGLIWCGVAAGGLIGLTETNFTLHLPFKRMQDQANLAIVRDYAATGSPAAFTRDPNFHGPHPDPRVVQHVIDDPALRATLPTAVFNPVYDSATERPWPIRHGAALTAISAAFLIGLLVRSLRAKSERPHPTVPAKPGAH